MKTRSSLDSLNPFSEKARDNRLGNKAISNQLESIEYILAMVDTYDLQYRRDTLIQLNKDLTGLLMLPYIYESEIVKGIQRRPLVDGVKSLPTPIGRMIRFEKDQKNIKRILKLKKVIDDKLAQLR